VELICDDQTGCKDFLYGVGDSAENCEANRSYLGQKIRLEKTSWICYSVSDNRNQNIKGEKEIVLLDEDGDGILNSCDECKGTGAGKISNLKGCALGDLSSELEDIDSDGDGLPDRWEDTYNALGCELDSNNPDSDGDNLPDPLEDYDEDGFSNFNEYSSESNPCVANEALPNEIPDTPIIERTLPTTSEGGNAVAWILLILGLFLMGGGMGYLIYYYRKPTTKARPSPGPSPAVQQSVSEKPSSGIISSWRNKLSELKKSRSRKARKRERTSLFSSFNKDSKSIPKLSGVVNKSSPHLPSIHKLAKHYASHKAEIKPGLRPEEKGIFAKLEGLAKRSKGKKVEDVVSKKEASDIFSKLKSINKKRKNK